MPFADDPLPLAGMLRLILIVGAIACVLTASLAWVAGRDRGGALAAIALLGLMWASNLGLILLVVLSMLVIAIERVFVKSGRVSALVPWVAVTRALNLVLVVLLILQVGRGAAVRAINQPVPVPPSWVASPRDDYPDIVLILVDGHARRDVALDRYHHDLSAFGQVLGDLGLSEASASFSNHSVTRYALSVLLNGRPMTELGQVLGQSADQGRTFPAISKSSGLALLRGAGYDVSVISSGYDHLPLRDVAHYVDVGPRSEAEQKLMFQSAVGRWFDSVTDGYASDSRTRLLREVDELGAFARTPVPGPEFMLAHIPAPHFPFVVNADCTQRTGDDYTSGVINRDGAAGDETAVRIAADQTRCVDTLVADVLRELVTVRPDAVVLLFSDHGPEELLDWRDPDPAAIHDRMANFFWWRSPGHASLFPADITLVNVLPILFNTCLGTDIGLHDNDLYFGPYEADPAFTPLRSSLSGLQVIP